MSANVISESPGRDPEIQESEKNAEIRKASAEHHDVYEISEKVGYDRQGAIDAENVEHNMGVLEAVQKYPAASWWAFVMSCTIIMEAYCVFIAGSFIALPAFTKRYGYYNPTEDKWFVTTSWQSALQMGGPVGAFIGVFLAGPLTSAIGYRWATISGLMALNGFIFIFYFGDSLGVFLAAQLLEGIPWGIFIANAPAYCSEIVPLRLRAPCTQMLQMFWALGAIIVGGVCYSYNENPGEVAYRIPIALQWLFPTPLAILIWWGPESPWWLVRKGRLEEAKKNVRRLGRTSAVDTLDESVAMMKRTIDLEKTDKEPSLLELWKGTDRYRTLIVCGVYAAQNLTGNLIANQAVFFFERAGMDTDTAFAMGLITSALQAIFVMLSWIMTTYMGRRTIYVWGSAINTAVLIAIGIAGSFPENNSSSLARASLGLIVSVLFCLGPAPASWVIIGETSSIRLRPLTTGVGRGCYYAINIPCIYLSSYMLNPDGGNLGAKCGYVWAATGFICVVVAWQWLPEMKNRSYREIDILFNRRVQARKWKNTVIDIQDDH